MVVEHGHPRTSAHLVDVFLVAMEEIVDIVKSLSQECFRQRIGEEVEDVLVSFAQTKSSLAADQSSEWVERPRGGAEELLAIHETINLLDDVNESGHFKGSSAEPVSGAGSFRAPRFRQNGRSMNCSGLPWIQAAGCAT